MSTLYGREGGGAAGGLSKITKRAVPLPPPPVRTNRTRRVLHPVLIGHAVSLTPYNEARPSWDSDMKNFRARQQRQLVPLRQSPPPPPY